MNEIDLHLGLAWDDGGDNDLVNDIFCLATGNSLIINKLFILIRY